MPASTNTALVTGAAGFIGANLVRKLLADQIRVVAVLRETTDPWRLPVGNAALRIVRATLRPGMTAVSESDIGRVDCVFHLAAAAVNQSVRDVSAMIEANVGGTLAALELAETFEVRRFVYVGSSGEYGPCTQAHEDQLPTPNAEYGATKTAGWLLAHAYGRRTGLPVVSVRPFSVFGPFEAAYRLVPYCTLQALDNDRMKMTDGRQTRDFVFVDDVVEGIRVAAARSEAVGGTFNLCTGVSTPVREIATTIGRLCAADAEPSFGTAATSTTEMWMTSGDPTRATRVLGWSAKHTIAEGLEKTRDWIAVNRRLYPEYRRQ